MTDNTKAEVERYHPSYCDKYEVLRGIYPNDRRLTGKDCSCGFEQSLLDWHNRHELQVRIEARIEEIEHVADYTNGMTHQMFENLKFRIAELEAERDRLNPSKSTPFNELKERDDE